MYNAQQTNQQTFFEPYFEELIAFRKQSQCSIKNWNVFDQEDDNDLQLIIEDVDVLDRGFGGGNGDDQKGRNLLFDPNLFEGFENMESENSSTLYNHKEEVIGSKSVEVPKSPAFIASVPKTKKINKRHKPSRPSRHRLTLTKLCYEKNICRNIIRKCIRAIQCLTYQPQIIHLCNKNIDFYEEFKQILVSSVQVITGPRALQAFLEPQDDVSKVFRKFLIWYLKQKYLMEALRGGQMDNLQKYIRFKNEVLLPLLKPI